MNSSSWQKELEKYERTSDKFILSARAIIRNENEQILVLFDKRHNAYATPGGKINLGESVLEGLKREVKEELGVNIVYSELILTKKILSQYGAFFQSTFLVDIDGLPTLNEQEKFNHITYLDIRKQENSPLGFEAYIDEKAFPDEAVTYDSLVTYFWRNSFPKELKNGNFAFEVLSQEEINEESNYLLCFNTDTKKFSNIEEKYFDKNIHTLLYRQKGIYLKTGIKKVQN